MTDFLLENEPARRVIKALGLPLPMPTRLDRAHGAYEERPIDGKLVVVGGAGKLHKQIAGTLAQAGAETSIVDQPEPVISLYRQQSEAWGRPLHNGALQSDTSTTRVHAVVFDGTGLQRVDQLDELYQFFHGWMRRLDRSGRVVVIGREADLENPEASAISLALEGFTRAVAREVGRTGVTANSIFVEEGAEARLEPVLRFFLSPRSAFITCQPVHVTNQSASEIDMSKVPTSRPLGGKVALVTGAARGIGHATVELLAAEGAHVVCLDRPEDDALLSQVARDIGGSTLLADVTATDAARTISNTLQTKYGGVDIVVHNAGITRDKTLANMSPEQWKLAVDVNLRAVVRITEQLLENRVLNDQGRLICLSSVSGIAGNRGQTNYSASKAGLVGYVRSLAVKLAERGITANAIAPGFIETRLTDAMPVTIREVARRMSALGQGGKPEDVGQAITFLATPGAIGITGQTLRVCGGALIGA